MLVFVFLSRIVFHIVNFSVSIYTLCFSDDKIMEVKMSKCVPKYTRGEF